MRYLTIAIPLGLALTGCVTTATDPVAERYAAAHPHGDAGGAQADLAGRDGQYDARTYGFGRARPPR